MSNEISENSTDGVQKASTIESDLPTYFAKTLAGMEQLLVAEVIELGAIGAKDVRRGVEFKADMATLFRVCLSSRFALTVLRPILSFDAQSPDELYKEANKWDWGSVMTAHSSFAIDVTVHSAIFTHSQFAMLRLKDAIVDYFREQGGIRPGVNREDPDMRIHMHISNASVTLSLDAAGRPLSRRGYRPQGAKAPLNEVLAAGLLAHSGWKPGTPLYDPMCGSGTFTMEAALWTDGLPIQWHRRKFAFMDWRGYDDEEWWHVRDEMKAKREKIHTPMFTWDKDFGAISQTRQSLANMELDGITELGRANFFKMKPRTETGVVVLNPPYGERLDLEDAPEFYKAIGDAFKTNWPDFSAWIISSDAEALKNVGLKTKRKIQCFNGPLECRWVGYDLYKGTAGGGKIEPPGEDSEQKQAEETQD
jgi:putative N6-adenine-specific DNA methylase